MSVRSPVGARPVTGDTLEGVAVDFPTEIKNLRSTMASVREVLDLEKLKKQIADLEEQSAAPDLWDDVESAQKITSALSRANAEKDRVENMDAAIDDLETLVEMGTEENDADTMAEAERELTKLTKAGVRALKAASNPGGFNLGMNQGDVAGAGVAAHLHQHIVPRWGGDMNFMPIIGRTKALPVLLEDSRQRIVANWPND